MEIIHLSSGAVRSVLAVGAGMPRLVHIGPDLGSFDPSALDRPVAHGAIDVAPPLGLIAEEASAFEGRPGLLGSRADGTAWSPRFVATGRPGQSSPSEARFELVDEVAGLGLDLTVEVHPSGVVAVNVALTNIGPSDYHLLRLAPSIPLPFDAAEVLTFTGRWCRELQPERQDLVGLRVVENRQGRTSHEQVPACFVGTHHFGEHHGAVTGVQLAWSGNHELAIERLVDETRHVQIGELLTPGEIILGPGDRYEAPEVLAAFSTDGLNEVSRAFHRHQRASQPLVGERKVLLNTWEAVYFDHNLETLGRLAEVAGQVGVERFVLDDGWFGSRRDDKRGLGDWWVSEEVWPDGLQPLIDRVHANGMDFGLWLEPEMVNPDSDLYRAHPEWTLVTEGYEPILGRQQLVLDLGRPEVCDYLFDHIDRLLTTYEIAYLKWDMNRRMVQASHHGRPGAHGHVLGLYGLLERLRSAHPSVEIESCSSGGGRIDAGILRRVQRVWTSDCNDALERQLIQRGFSLLHPPEVMGAHIGPDAAHTTGRRQPLGFRLATAFFGHLGIEWNLLDAGDEDRARIAAAIAAYKRLRPLLHGGDVVRIDHPDPAVVAHGVVSPDRGEAVFAFVQMAPSRASVPLPLMLEGLDPERIYRVEVIDDLASAVDYGRSRPSWMDGSKLSGAQLLRSGLQPPLLHPESVLLLELTAS
ncbi:MAG: alpha-galactosidase [Actinomycetota bacterium]